MPCQTDITPEEIAAWEDKKRETLVAPYKAETDRVTAMLCGLLTALAPITTISHKGKSKVSYDYLRVRGLNSDGGITIGLPEDLCEWWTKHQRADKARKAAELRRTALAKLTPEEVAALGLDTDDI